MSSSKRQALLLMGFQRTSSDLLDFLHYITEPLTLLIPATFFNTKDVATFAANPLVEVKPLQANRSNTAANLAEVEKQATELSLAATPLAEYQKEVKELLLKSLPVSIELIDALEEAKEDYQLLGFVTTNEAFPRERLIRDWCSQQGLPTLHINHGLILAQIGGAYADFATTAFTTACPNELIYLEHAFKNSATPPELHIAGLPSWDKYALLKSEEQAVGFRARLGLTLEQQLITFFPTVRNVSYVHNPNSPDPHLKGIQDFITLAAELAKNLPDAVFIIKDRPGNQQFMEDYVALEASKKGLSTEQLRYVFDHAEPYVAFSTLVISPKSTISSEAVICEVPYIHIFEGLWEPFAYDPEAQVAHTHTTEAVEFITKLLTQPEELAAVKAAQKSSNQLTGPGRDFCSSLRVAQVMAQVFGKEAIAEQIAGDLQAWQHYLTANPQPSVNDLLNDSQNPLGFHWQNVQKLLTFDERFSEEAVYNTWLRHKAPLPVDGQLMAERMQNMWRAQPSFHLIYIVDASLFNALADSLAGLDDQIYKSFGISIISSAPCPDESLLTLSNLQWVVAEQPFEQINAVINAVESDWVMLLQPGDELLPDALFNFADYANLKPDWLAIYADEDRRYLDQQGEVRRKNPSFKPDFNHELLLSTNYIGQCVALRRDAIHALEGLSSLAYVQNEDFLLRLAERMTIPAIGHIPMIANHRSSVLDETLKSEIVELTGSVIRQEHLQRCGHETAEVLPGLKPVTWQVKYPLTTYPSVALLLPLVEWHEAVPNCIESILQTTHYPNWKLCIAAPKNIIAFFSEEILNSERIQFTEVPPANSRVATYTLLAASQTDADFYCLLETDVHCVQPSWLEQLVMHGQRATVGLVAPRLVRPNGRIFSAGQILGMQGAVGDLYQNFHLEQDLNNQPRAWCDQNFSALNPSCVLISRKNFAEFGLNNNYPDRFYMADLGLRMQLKGWRLHWTPYATLACQGYIEYGKEQTKQEEQVTFYQEWFDLLINDPAHNPNLELRGSGSLPQISLITTWHPVYRQQPRILLVPLHINSTDSQLLGGLSYFLDPLEKAEKIRLNSSAIELQAKEHDLPSLVELARTDADLVIFFGEEVGNTLGRAKQLKEFTGCKIAVYTPGPLTGTSWADTHKTIDLHFSADKEVEGAIYIPKVDEHWKKDATAGVVAGLEEAIMHLLNKT